MGGDDTPPFFGNKMVKKRVISILLSLVLVFNGIIIAIITPYSVLALSSTGLQSTIASIIISLMLECGVAPVNNTWITRLNNAYGVESSIGTIQDAINSGLLINSGGSLIDNGLSNAIVNNSAYNSLGLSEIFTTTSDDIINGVVAGSGGVNLTNAAINVGTVGTIGAYAGAVSVGIGVGVLANHIREKFINFIRNGAKITYDDNIINNCPNGSTCYYTSYGSVASTNYRTIYYYVKDNCSVASYNDYEGVPYIYYVAGVSKSGKSELYKYIVRFNNNTEAQSETTRIYTTPQGLYEYGGVGNWGTPDTNVPYFAGKYQDAITYLNNVKNGVITEEKLRSPDLIGKDGNHEASYNPENNSYYDDSIRNVVPEGYDMKPVNMDDYMDYVDEANKNTEEGNKDQNIQGETFDNLIDSILVEPSIIPDQGVVFPDVPERPIIPDQPIVPGKDPITGEEQSEVLEGITTPDLRSVFPFCIPFDLYQIVNVLKNDEREAPIIIWEFALYGNDYNITLDFSIFNEAASLLRLLELLIFIVGLALATRKLIGASG